MSSEKCRVALALGFLSQFAKLPRKAQKKTSEWVARFQNDPKSTGINYEHIEGARDKNLRSVRMGDDYRGIVCAPEKGNIYMLLWVDHHEEAYAWAQNRICKVNPETGALQVVVGTSLPDEIPAPMEPPPVRGLFAQIKDKELLRLGVPEENLAVVRGATKEKELDALVDVIPEEALDPLYMLAAGYTMDQVQVEVGIGAQPNVNVDDFDTALQTAESLRRFVVVETELELQRILDAPLEQWRVFLHPSQRRLVERDWSGPVRVLGGAGTGKTVVAMHRARWLAKKRCARPDQKILFTTFTKNLAQDIHSNLEKLCPECLDQIEVVNLDSWVARFLKQKEVLGRICYGQELTDLWQQALSEQDGSLGLSEGFYRDEWEQVVQPQSVTTKEQYFKARRVGRGTRLNRQKRAVVWKVFAAYRQLLESAGLLEADDAMRLATQTIQSKEATFPYLAIIVDEAQDMGAQAFTLLRTIAGKEHDNDMFVVGDAHQRIYGHSVVLGRCGIRIVGRGRKLRVNYRTTEQIRRHAVSILSGVSVDDLDGGRDDNRGYKSLMQGAKPELRGFDTFDEQMSFIAECISGWQREGIAAEGVCLVGRTNNYVTQMEAVLAEKGIDHCIVKPDQPESRKKGVRLATMHRVKGLEFDAVVVAGLGAEQFPVLPGGDLDAAALRMHEAGERCLLYVALTRAKRAAALCWHGAKSRLVD